jgi:hypothetical protein
VADGAYILLEATGTYQSEVTASARYGTNVTLTTIQKKKQELNDIPITPLSHMVTLATTSISGSWNISDETTKAANVVVRDQFHLASNVDLLNYMPPVNLASATSDTATTYFMILSGISKLADDSQNGTGIQTFINSLGTKMYAGGLIDDSVFQDISRGISQLSTDSYFKNIQTTALVDSKFSSPAVTGLTQVMSMGNSVGWSKTTSSGMALTRHDGAWFDDNFYYWGGMDASSVATNALVKMDSHHNYMSTTTCGPARYDHTVTYAAGKLISYGGVGPTGQLTNSVWIYDFLEPDQNSKCFEVVTTNAPGAYHTGHSAVLVQSGIAFVGGDQSANASLPVTVDFLVLSDKPYWTTTEVSSTVTWRAMGRKNHVSLVNEFYIYNLGGLDYNNQVAAGRQVDILVPSEDMRSVYATFGTTGGTARHSHAGIIHGNDAYLWGGVGVSGAATNALDIYDMSRGLWKSAKPGGTARSRLTAVSAYDSDAKAEKIYFYGGSTGVSSQATNLLDVFTIPNSEKTQVSPVDVTVGFLTSTASMSAGGTTMVTVTLSGAVQEMETLAFTLQKEGSCSSVNASSSETVTPMSTLDGWKKLDASVDNQNAAQPVRVEYTGLNTHLYTGTDPQLFQIKYEASATGTCTLGIRDAAIVTRSRRKLTVSTGSIMITVNQ